ncbi:MAG: polysaccharide pyruvyl transferase family protein [Ruminococcus sp.]
MVICPQANLFNKYFNKTILSFISVFKNIKIPVYMIACGAQADSYDKLDELVEKIGDVTKELIETVYSTGGEFALRGNFTKEFFDRLGENTAVVTGCPSIYQMGRDLYVSNKKVGKEEFKPLFNGNLVKETYDYPESMYIDQETFFYYLYNTSLIQNTKSVDLYRLIKMHGYAKVYLLFSNRIRLFVSMNEWFNYIKINGFNFSCGSRIHGNIMPILAGVPSMIYPCDSRVREMAEFYSIPLYDNSKKRDVYEQYLEADYTKFNRDFGNKFDLFEAFLKSHNIVENINCKSIFLYDKDYEFECVNVEVLRKMRKRLKCKKYKLYDKAIEVFRKVR